MVSIACYDGVVYSVLDRFTVVVSHMLLSDIDVKAASKFLGGKFACGASVTGDDEIVIQGDFVDDLFDVLPEKWPQVS